jgi:hypothetical protein
MNLLDTASLVVTPNGYKASKLYSIIPSDGTGDMTFARTGDTATRVNSSGLIETVLANKPRLDYTSSTCPKLLLEPQRSNLNTYSEEFDNAAWTKVAGTITANSIASPDGTVDADTYNAANASFNILRKTITTVIGTTYTASIFVKKNNYRYIGFRWVYAGTTFNFYDFDTNTINNTASSANPLKIENYGNGWIRLTITATATDTSHLFDLAFCNSSGNTNPASAGTEKYYVWGAQLEAGSYATSYIPTTTASVTRNADSCYKTSISSLFGASEGTIFLDYKRNNSEGSEDIWVSDGSYNNFGYWSNSNTRFVFVINGHSTKTLIATGLTTNERYKIAVGYKANDYVLYVNGVQKATNSTSGSVQFSQIGLSTEQAYPYGENNPINSAVIWKTRLQNSELATLTTI